MAGKLNSFIDRVLENVPEEKRAAIRSEYSAAQDEVRSLEEANARVQQVATAQTEWWNRNKDTVAERDRLKAELEAARNPNNNNHPAGLSETDVTKRITDAVAAAKDEMLQTGLGLTTVIPTLSVRHYQEFGEVLDSAELAKAAIASGRTIQAEYDHSVAERRQTRANEKLAADLAKAREEGKQEGIREQMARAGSNMPYPVGQTAPTTLSGLKKPAEGANPFSLEAAVATANEVAASQAGR